MKLIEKLTDAQCQGKNTTKSQVVGNMCPSSFGMKDVDATTCKKAMLEKGYSCKECWDRKA